MEGFQAQLEDSRYDEVDSRETWFLSRRIVCPSSIQAQALIK